MLCACSVVWMSDQPQCFVAEHDGASASYSEGVWRLQRQSEEAPPYRIMPHFWKTIGSKMNKDLPQHYGKCDDASGRTSGGHSARALYRWDPLHCSLLPFEKKSVCRVLRGKQILVVGDSTVFQFFLSLVFLLNGRFGRDVKHGYVIADLTASACGDSTRLNFVRSDLLLWTSHITDYHAVQRCDGFTILHPFVQRASRDADIVLLGVGHHFPRGLMLAEKWSRWSAEEAAKRARVSFFAGNLNHTLSSLLKRRSEWGRHDPASVVVLGASTPVRNCERFEEPLASLANAVEAHAGAGGNGGEPSTNELRWMEYPRYNQLARWLAAAFGASFLDVAAPSALRPDGAMARFWPRIQPQRRRDCVHYCLPGVVDAWSTLFYNLLASPRLQRALRATVAPGEGVLGTAGSSRAPARSAAASTDRDDPPRELHTRRFLDANTSHWHNEMGFAERFEVCRGRLGPMRCSERLQTQPWWAFHCWDARDRAANKGADYDRQYVRWMPAESFD